MPPGVKRLMRDKDVKTTLGYYVDQEGEDVAGVVWEAVQKATANTNTSGHPPRETPRVIR